MCVLMHIYIHRAMTAPSPHLAGSELPWVGEGWHRVPGMPVDEGVCNRGPWVLNLGHSQRNTSLVVSMATSQFNWNGKPQWFRARSSFPAARVHKAGVLGEEESVGNFYFNFP